MTEFDFGYDGGSYCPECDGSFIDCAIVPINECFELYACPECGAINSKLMMTDYGWDLREYLLGNSEHDEGLIPLYDGTFK